MSIETAPVQTALPLDGPRTRHGPTVRRRHHRHSAPSYATNITTSSPSQRSQHDHHLHDPYRRHKPIHRQPRTTIVLSQPENPPPSRIPTHPISEHQHLNFNPYTRAPSCCTAFVNSPGVLSGARIGRPRQHVRRLGYDESVARDIVRQWSEEEFFADALPPTDDDVPIAVDGRVLDSPEKLIAYLDEINRRRATPSADA